MKRLLVALLCACNSSPADTCDASSSCTDANDTAPPVSGGGCDSSKPQSQGGCAVDDTDGFFVSPTGSDTANGSKATPFKTVQMGATTAAANPLKPNVYICVGTYPENLTLTNATAGVALHGGFDCTSWAQVNGTTNVAPLYATGASQFVVHVAGAAALLESLTVTAPDVSDLDVSSVGVLIDNSVGMTFRRATILAGKAGDGSTATTPSMSSANMSGASAGATTGGAATDCKCAPTDSVGGQGGGTDAGASTGQPSITGQDGGAAGGNTFANCPGGNGANGVDGPPGTSTGTYGGITTHGWVPSNGNAGTSGGTGQGGGGGGSPGNGTGGGGGGCGGCGGVGGVGGGGGGGSIAVAVIASIVRLQVTTLRAGNAGNGGDGAIGQPGQPGGSGGMGWDIDPCTGGTGGMGGAGGASGGGAGGISVALATTDGAMPNIDTQSTLLAGQAGAGGHDGTTMAGKAIDGIAAAQHAF